MARCNIYLDESGDLGFTFDAPYRKGGSSRHLTLSAVVCKEDSNKHIKRFIRDFYIDKKIPTGRELKWVDLDAADRIDFAHRAARLVKEKVDISYLSITVYKQRVLPHIQADPNKLYNYMTGVLLVPVMKQYDDVCFVPDARTLKVKSGNSLHDYLQIKLWFDESAKTKLVTSPSDSTKSRPLHFTDYLCGAIQSHHEDSLSHPRNILNGIMHCKRLYFPEV